MTCEESQELIIDILYGEEADSRRCFQFFRHLETCTECNHDYLQLLETRDALRKWTVQETEPVEGTRVSRRYRFSVWPLLQKVAASIMLLAGGMFLLQYLGVAQKEYRLSRHELTEMVHDTVVAEQARERKLIGAALLQVKEESTLERREQMREIYNHLLALEQRYLESLEQNNRSLRTLLSR
ncbi:MAG: hypothetical protein HY645_11390 [Acidobacteria bacterium]|nr:hypothetical protein [Acidobacteriota bacterium]